VKDLWKRPYQSKSQAAAPPWSIPWPFSSSADTKSLICTCCEQGSHQKVKTYPYLSSLLSRRSSSPTTFPSSLHSLPSHPTALSITIRASHFNLTSLKSQDLPASTANYLPLLTSTRGDPVSPRKYPETAARKTGSE